MMGYTIALFLDSRRPKSNGLFPIKLKIYSVESQTNKLYSTRYEMTKKEFKSIWETHKTRKENRQVKNELQAIINRASDICKTLQPFSFSHFEKKYLRNKGDGINVVYHYQEYISILKKGNRFGTASNYESSLKSIKRYLLHLKGVKLPSDDPTELASYRIKLEEITQIPFSKLTADFLQDYEDYMVNDLGRSRTTISMYLRALKRLFNLAIDDKEIDLELYPFGKKKYVVPAVKNVKKTLKDDEIKKLYNSIPKNRQQEGAKDFWFFIYSCNGINVKDIALLKYEDIHDDKIIFYRAKTLNTSKKDLKPIIIYLEDYAIDIIAKYGKAKAEKGKYVFSILAENDKGEVQRNKIKNFTKFINQNIKKLAMNEGITADLSTYWARHSLARTIMKGGGNHELIKELYGHSSITTTDAYLGSFEDEDVRSFMKKITSL